MGLKKQFINTFAAGMIAASVIGCGGSNPAGPNGGGGTEQPGKSAEQRIQDAFAGCISNWPQYRQLVIDNTSDVVATSAGCTPLAISSGTCENVKFVVGTQVTMCARSAAANIIDGTKNADIGYGYKVNDNLNLIDWRSTATVTNNPNGSPSSTPNVWSHEITF